MKLNETYESYIELKKLAQDIYDAGWKIDDYVLYSLRIFVKGEYTVIKDFVNAKIGFLTHDINTGNSNASWVQPKEFPVLIKALAHERPDLNISLDGYIGIVIVKNSKFDYISILHELQHAFDDFRAEGKLVATKLGSRYYKKFMHTIEHDKSDFNIPKAYFRTPHEKSAFFTTTIDSLDFFIDNKYTIIRPIRDVYDDFKDNYTGYHHLTPKDRKILSRKFSQYYYKIKDDVQQNKPVKEMKILTLDDYKNMNEDFYNPYDEATQDTNPKFMSDKGGLLKLRKETFNINRVEYSKRTNGQYTVLAKDMIASGEIVEICPVIACGIEAKAIDGIKDHIFEIDKLERKFGLVLGYGSLYQHSEKPNLEFGYNKNTKQMYFTSIRMIRAGEELTIDYGKDYWDERKSFNTLAPMPKPEPENESGGMGLPQNAADITGEMRTKQFGMHDNPANPAISGVAIMGPGQS